MPVHSLVEVTDSYPAYHAAKPSTRNRLFADETGLLYCLWPDPEAPASVECYSPDVDMDVATVLPGHRWDSEGNILCSCRNDSFFAFTRPYEGSIRCTECGKEQILHDG